VPKRGSLTFEPPVIEYIAEVFFGGKLNKIQRDENTYPVFKKINDGGKVPPVIYRRSMDISTFAFMPR
jgi:hypothetical protein